MGPRRFFPLALTALLFLFASASHAQTRRHYGEAFELDTVLNPRLIHIYQASDHIELLPGFKTEPLHGRRTELGIDPYGIHPPTEGLTGGPESWDEGVVGAFGGVVDVGAMGAAVYSIPIRLPQGINGMQPSLSITYNSQAGNGLMGWGWDLSGLSAVERTGRTRYHDGVTGAVTLDDATDRFMLDGVRLVEAADYGDSLEFKTELDRKCRVMAYVSPVRSDGEGGGLRTSVITHFKVSLADGRFMEYGGTSDSRIEPQQGGVAALCWLLDKVSDRNGNSVVYHYSEQTGTGEWYVSSIDYTEHAENGSITVSPEFTVHFAYRSVYNQDLDFSYVAGSMVRKRKLIDHISVVRNGTGAELERYSFVYQDCLPQRFYDSVYMHTRLDSILFETDGLSLNPTRIGWTSYKDDNVMYNIYMTEQDTAIYRNFPFVGDFNGDGYSDIAVAPMKDSAYLTGPNLRFFLNTPQHPGHFNACSSMTVSGLATALDWVYAADLNDDGFDDLIAYCLDSTAQSGVDSVWISVYQNDAGSGFLYRSSTGFRGSRPSVLTGDFLGTGDVQMMLFPVQQTGNVPSSSPKLLHYADGSPVFSLMTGPCSNVLDIVAGDFDGDGRTDVAMVREDATTVCSVEPWNGTFRFVPLFACDGINHANGVWRHVFAGDLNGDGMTDLLCGERINSDHARWLIFFSTGISFTATDSIGILWEYTLPDSKAYPNSLKLVTYDILHPLPYTQPRHGICLADLDGDGAADIAGMTLRHLSSNIELFFRFNPDTQYFQSRFNSADYNGQHYSPDNSYYYINCRSHYFHIGNFMGKDNLSFLGLEDRPAGWVVERRKPGVFSLKPSSSLNNVESVTDGLGNITRIDYGYVLAPFGDLGYGVRRPAVPLRVLSDVTSYNAAGRPMRTEYRFADPCHHRDGHGWIGFRRSERRFYANGDETGSEVSIQSLETMGGHAMLLPVADTAYLYPDGVQVPSSVTDYQYEKVLSSYGSLDANRLVVCPALTGKTVTRYDPDTPGQILSKTFTENHYNYTDGLYCHSYHCDSTLTGTGGPTSTGYTGCEFRTSESTAYCQDDCVTWTLDRPGVRTLVLSSTGKPDVARCQSYAYTAANPFLPGRVHDIPSRGVGQHPLALQIDFEYYSDGNLRKKTVDAPFGQHGELPRFHEYGYGSTHRLVNSETISGAGLSYSTGYHYDAFDLVDTLTSPNGLPEVRECDPLEISSLVVKADGARIHTVRRWAAGHPLSPTGASYYTWSGSSDGVRTLVFFHKTGAELRTVTYDLNGRPVVTDRQYDLRGRLSAVSEPYRQGDTVRWTCYGYDGLDRPVSVTRPDSTTTSFLYDGFVTETAVASPDGCTHRCVETVNAMGWTVRSEDPDGSYVAYDHYADGLLASAAVNGDASATVTVAYDDARNRTSVTDPDYGTFSAVYDAYGRLMESASSRELASQTVTEYTYDGLGRPARVTDGFGHTVTEYTYNESGKTKGTLGTVLYAAQGGPDIQRVIYAYDSLARPVASTETRPEGIYTTLFEYDSISRLSRLVHPTGYAVRYRYSRGRLRTVTGDDGEPLWRTDSLDANGRLLSVRQGRNMVTRFAYDPVLHLMTATETVKGGAYLQQFQYAYDNFGNLTSRMDTMHNLVETFVYDSLDRLTGVSLGGVCTGAMAYDGYGRMIAKTAGGSAVFSGAVYNQTSKPHALDKAVTAAGVFPATPQTASYTGFDKVLMVRQGNDSLCYTYGHDRQRISMEEKVGNTLRTKRYVGNCEYVTETDTAGTRSYTRTYLTGPAGVFAVVVTENGTDSVHYILKDHLGSWTAVTDSEGDVEQRLSYDAWGNLRDPDTWSGSFTGRPMFDRGFTGHEHLTAFGLINMNGRMYDPMMSSFLSVDRYVQYPGRAQGFNRYAYCLHNPLRYVDPTGWYAGAPVSRAGLIREYLTDPCYITRQQLREAGMYDIEGGYSWCGGQGSMNAGWMEADGQLHTSDWGITTNSGGFEAGAWAIPTSFTPMWINDCLGYCDYGDMNYENNSFHINMNTFPPCGNGRDGGNRISVQQTNDVLKSANTILGALFSQNASMWTKPQQATHAQKQYMQKVAYQYQKKQKAKGLKPKNVKEIKASKGARFVKASRGFTLLGLGLETADILYDKEIQMSNMIDVGVTVASCWYWPVGAIYLGVDVGSLIFTGNDIGYYIDDWYGKPIYEWNND